MYVHSLTSCLLSLCTYPLSLKILTPFYPSFFCLSSHHLLLPPPLSPFPRHLPFQTPQTGLVMGYTQIPVMFAVGDSLGSSSFYCTGISMATRAVGASRILPYFTRFCKGIGNWWQVQVTFEQSIHVYRGSLSLWSKQNLIHLT